MINQQVEDGTSTEWPSVMGFVVGVSAADQERWGEEGGEAGGEQADVRCVHVQRGPADHTHEEQEHRKPPGTYYSTTIIYSHNFHS